MPPRRRYWQEHWPYQISHSLDIKTKTKNILRGRGETLNRFVLFKLHHSKIIGLLRTELLIGTREVLHPNLTHRVNPRWRRIWGKGRRGLTHICVARPRSGGKPILRGVLASRSVSLRPFTTPGKGWTSLLHRILVPLQSFNCFFFFW